MDQTFFHFLQEVSCRKVGWRGVHAIATAFSYSPCSPAEQRSPEHQGNISQGDPTLIHVGETYCLSYAARKARSSLRTLLTLTASCTAERVFPGTYTLSVGVGQTLSVDTLYPQHPEPAQGYVMTEPKPKRQVSVLNLSQECGGQGEEFIGDKKGRA